MSRKAARDNAFKCIYEYEFNKDKDIDKIIEEICIENECVDIEREYIEQVTRGVIFPTFFDKILLFFLICSDFC